MSIAESIGTMAFMFTMVITVMAVLQALMQFATRLIKFIETKVSNN